MIASTSSSGEASASNLESAKAFKDTEETRRKGTRSHPDYVVYTRVCVNCGGMSINSIFEGKMSLFRSLITGILVVDPGMLFYVSVLSSKLRPQSIQVSRCLCSGYQKMAAMVISEISGEGTEDSAISSRTSNHRPVRLMKLFGYYKGFHPRNRRHKELTRGSCGCGSGWKDQGRRENPLYL